ncbi:MAG: LuxR C-terminal-related transcriptional regulator [Acidimicrobiales bacterium]
MSSRSEEPRPSWKGRGPETDAQLRDASTTLSLEEPDLSEQALPEQALSPSQHSSSEPARTVIACVAISTATQVGSREAWSSVAKRLVAFVRQDDRICMVGSGRLIVMFKNVDRGLHAQVLGARLASSVAGTLSDMGIESRKIRIGIADGDPSADALRLSFAAISASKQSAIEDQDLESQPFLVVHTSVPRTNGHSPRLARRVVRRGTQVVGQQVPDQSFFEQPGQQNGRMTPVQKVAAPSVLIVDSSPLVPGARSPASAAVRSLVIDAGMQVAAMLAPTVDIDSSLLALEGVVEHDAMALLVIHPGSETEAPDDHNGSLERPAAITHALRQLGMRVLAVSVGANEIALAECLLQGAESAFSLSELPEGLTHALSHRNGDQNHAETNGVGADHNGQRSERLAKLLLLTRSERRVLYHLTTGATAIEIAEKLVLSLATVRSHIRSILRKLEVSSQLAAVAIAQGHPARPAEPDHERA